MAYWITRFGDVELPLINALDDISVASTVDSFAVLPGGGTYDPFGSGQAPPAPTYIRKEASYHEATPELLQDAIYALRALRGRRAKLYRTTSQGEEAWTWARLMELTGEREVRWADLPRLHLLWRMLSPVWYGEARAMTLVDLVDDSDDLATTGAESLTAFPLGFTVTNYGNAPISNPVWTITAGSATITSVTLEGVDADDNAVWELQWTGTLLAGDDLVIDCGAHSVTNDGANAYSGFTLGSGHSIAEWCRLDPGANLVNVTIGGGSVTDSVTVEFSDGWE